MCVLLVSSCLLDFTFDQALLDSEEVFVLLEAIFVDDVREFGFACEERNHDAVA